MFPNLNHLKLPFIENVSSIQNTIFSFLSNKYAKIALVAIGIFGAFAALYALYRCYDGSRPTPTPPPASKKPVPAPYVAPKTVDPAPPAPSPRPTKKVEPTPTPTPAPLPKPVSPTLTPTAKKPDEQPSDADMAAILAVLQQDEYDQGARKPKPIPAPPQPTIYTTSPATTTPIYTPPPVAPAPVFVPLPVVTPNPVATQPIAPASKPNQKVPEAPFSKQVEEICQEVHANVLLHPSYSTKKAFDPLKHSPNYELVVNLLNELVTHFERKYPQNQTIHFGDQVPAFFAKVNDGRPKTERKYLSLAGIRNLVKYGPQIFDDFTAKRFLGGKHHYTNYNGGWIGLELFHQYCGNVVDLDTELDDKIKTDAEAMAIARKKIVEFGKECGLKGVSGRELTAEEVARQLPDRKLDLPYNGPVILTDRNDYRSNQGIWKRIDPQETRYQKILYYVNVPDLNTVVCATLKFPYMLAEVAWRAKQSNHGTLPQNFLDDLFENGIMDGCYNVNMRAFEIFHLKWTSIFDANLSPKEEARQNIENGKFGDEIKLKGANAALNEAFTRASLGALFETSDDFNVAGRSKDKWIQEITPQAIDFLIAKGVWETRLYQTDTESDFFLLNATTLKSFLTQCYEGNLAQYW